MTLNLNVPVTESQLTPKITVIGVGGAGGNAVNNMIQANLEGVNFLVANTDAQALSQSLCEQTVQIGRHITQGLGAGSQPDVGRAAAEEAMDEILAALEGVNMVFITAGMGGGTGTGAAPVIARAAREAGILTVGVCTKPFQFEGIHRMRIGEAGLSDLQQYVDTLIIIPNQNLFRVANENTTFADAFKMADDVLHAGVRGVTDLIVMPGLINLDFADIRSVMTEMGKAMMGTGEGEGDNRAVAAAEAAISNPLLDDVSMKGARGVLINITGGDDLTLFEVDEAANRIRDEVDPEANIIFGSTFEASMEGRMRVSVVSTGIDVDESVVPRPVSLSLVTSRARSSVGETAASDQTETGSSVTAMENAAPAEAEPAAERIVAEAEAPPAAPKEERSEEVETVPVRAAALAAESAPADTFVAPAPMEPEPAHATARSMEPDPFAAAELINSARPQAARAEARDDMPRTKAHTLLAKVTGAARAFHEATQASAPIEEAEAVPANTAEPAKPRSSVEPARTAEAVADRPSDLVEGARTAEPAQNQARLAGLDPADRLGMSPNEEDLLDIPAFLRRQAN
jgi:cell division protein FtsZ